MLQVDKNNYIYILRNQTKLKLKNESANVFSGRKCFNCDTFIFMFFYAYLLLFYYIIFILINISISKHSFNVLAQCSIYITGIYM